jgi:hypothetical protein
MASRFWVTGGTGNWNSTTNWSATSGGASGASVPSTADTATFNASSGAGTATLDISPTVQTLTCTGFTGTLAFGTNTISLNSTGTIFTGATTMTVTGTPQIICTDSSATTRNISPQAVTEANSISFRITAGTGSLNLSTAGVYRNIDFTDGTNPTGYAGAVTNTSITIYGNFKASTGMSFTGGTGTYTFAATSGTKTITSAAVTIDRPFTFNGVGGTWQLQDALTSGSTRTLTLTSGTLNLSSYTLTTGLFSSSNSNVRTLAFGTGKIVLTGNAATVWSNGTSTNMTITGTAPLVQATYSGSTGTRVFTAGYNDEATSISLEITAGSDSISLASSTAFYKNISFSGFTGTHATTGSTVALYGNWNWGGVTTNSSTTTIVFSATSGTKTVTSNGVSFGGDVNFNGIGGTFELQDALTISLATASLSLNGGTLDFKNFTVTSGRFSGSASAVRTLAFGTGKLVLTGNNSTVCTTNTGTNLTITGSKRIELAYSGSVGQRSISGPQTASAIEGVNILDYFITAGSDIVNFNGARQYGTIDFSNGGTSTFSGSWIPGDVTMYGDLVLKSGMSVTGVTVTVFMGATSGTQKITSAGQTFDFLMNFNGAGGTRQLQDALTLGSTRTTSLTRGTLDLNNFVLTTGIVGSSTSEVRAIAFGTGNITLTGLNTTIWSMATATNFSYTGTPTVNVTGAGTGGQTRTISHGSTAGGTEANAPSFNISAGADSITTTGNSAIKNLNFTGFTGTLNANGRFIYGNLILSSGMTLTAAGASTTTFAATSGTNTITSAGQTIDFPVTFNGAGGTWSLQDALTLGSARQLTLTAGTLTTNSYAVTVGNLASNNSNVRTFNLGASTVTILLGNGIAFNLLTSTNLTFNAGTSTIVFSSIVSADSTVTIYTGGVNTFNNFSFPSAPSYRIVYIINGQGTFNNLSASAPLAGIQKAILVDQAPFSVTGTLTLTGANGNQRITFAAYQSASARTISAGAVSLTDVDFQLITAAGAAINWSGTRLGNLGGNSNINFGAGTTRYFSSASGGAWSDNVWAASSGGTPSTIYYPLAQDTVVFDNAGINAGSTVSLSAPGTQIGAVNFSALTNSITWNFNGVGGYANIYGDLTMSSYVSVTGTAPGLNFDCGSSVLTVRSEGVSFPYARAGNQNAYNAGGSVNLFDDFRAPFVLGSMNLNLNGKILYCTTFSSSYSLVAATRLVAFNGGSISIDGNAATVWDCTDLTGFTYSGTPTVNFTYSGSVGTRTFNNGNTAGGTEANAVDLNIVSGSDAIGTAGVVRNFTLQPAFTGSSQMFANGFIYGNLLLSPSQTITSSASATTFAATSGTKTITTNGVTLDRSLTFNGLGGSWVLGGALTMGATNGYLLFVRGTFSTANYNVVALRWQYDYVTVIGTVVLNLGSSTITLNPSGQPIPWQMGGANAGFLTINGGTSNIVFNTTVAQASMNPSSGNTVTYYKVTQAGANNLLLNDGMKLNTLQNTAQPTTISFRETATVIGSFVIDNFNVSGTAGNLVTIASKTPGSQFSIAKNTGGKVLVSYCTISDSAASPSGYWFAPTSQGNVDGGNNTGWNFGSDGGRGGFLTFF